ncbi:F0F1 ATP synthase subunit B [Novisyntrophococcus fermenticellae]|uniref:F0F1 ATP synthase subunit B n=1 Tax=Novisyntrophococcus fermenticellae TaxID=2068655 RepID=UPI001E28E3D5|nr:F0F1 ATP synthase subunit B [Novisyntrophococcus fermenticellae]
MLNISFWNMAGVVIEVLLLYLCLKKFLFKPIKAIQEKRQAMIDGQMQHAEQKNSEALELKSQYEEKIASMQDESDQMIEKAKKDAQFEYERIISQANSEAGSLMKKAKDNIELEREKAKHEMESQVADLALLAASRILGEKSGAESDQALYDQFLNKAGDSDDRDRN